MNNGSNLDFQRGSLLGEKTHEKADVKSNIFENSKNEN
jgi:hypothetical protein